ncbi:MAG: radical SAM protein [Deltaproteobacteria bacterium]|nr:radical SAM protein [Deltaproteobacteria bacterium]MBW2051188.1 radical SAM protein [Deltaproteobacteria bacterium]MBW2141925.1 radical SAM protein [Deltaproteobacteria bacterium]MBW2323454.1 radical SAM protein [Deltaproteobacteria bacterium]
MDAQPLLTAESTKTLLQTMINNKTVRKKIISFIEQKSYQDAIEVNSDNRPRQVQEDRHDYSMALLHGFLRAFELGQISKHGIDRLMEIFLSKVVMNKESEEASCSLGLDLPFFLVISPTGKCNLKCTGCYATSDSSQKVSLDFNTFDRILTEKRELWGSHFTAISGGEPLLWRDGKFDFLDMIERHSNNMFMFYTNGTLITDEVAKRMAELGNVTPAISVEGFEEETDARRGKGTYTRIMNALESLKKYGVFFGISVTPTKYNWEVATSDRLVDFYFMQQGAVYGWLFQYMPIGRGQTLDLMVTPEQRVEMYKRMVRIVRERKVFLADFWNSGTAAGGCLSAGRKGGYYYIDWHGNVTPCVFIPYAADNIHRIYKSGGNINTPLKSSFFKKINTWQDEYGYRQPAEKLDNWLCPCVIRDHFGVFREAAIKSNAKPINEEAAIALNDSDYCTGMINYGEELKRLTDPIWIKEYLSTAVSRDEDQQAVLSAT